MSALLLVDFSNALFKSVFVNPHLSHRGIFTGGVYGFLRQVTTAIRECRATRVVVCRDAPPYLRKQQDPSYKSDRKKEVDELTLHRFSQSKKLALEMLEVLGIPVWTMPGFEADDLIAWAALLNRHRYKWVAAAANDSDLFQIFCSMPNFYIFRGQQQGAYTVEDFRKDYGPITRDQWIFASALCGTHNGVSGVDGFGPKTALAAAIDVVKFNQATIKHREVINRNIPLIRLPHSAFPRDPQLHVALAKLDEPALTHWCAKIGMTVTNHMIETLEQVSEK